MFEGHVNFQNHVPDGHVNQMLNIKSSPGMASSILPKLVNIGSGNGFLPNGTKPIAALLLFLLLIES